MDYRFSLL